MRTPSKLRYLIGPLELIHDQAGSRLLRFVRLGIFALWIVKLLLDPLWRLADLPHGMFNPVGILRQLPSSVLDELFTANGLTGLLVFSIVVCLLAMTDKAFPLVSTVAVVALTVYSSVIRSFGPAVHTDIILLLSAYALAGYAWADWLLSQRGAEKSSSSDAWSSYPLITIVAMLALSYSMVGLNRTIAGGIDVFTGNTMEAWCIDASLRGYYFNTNIGWHIPDWPWVVFMLRAGLPIITLFEIAAPLVLAWPHFRWIFIPTMLSFHLLSLVFMNIFFFDDMLIYLLLIDWSRRFPSLSSTPIQPA